MDVQTKPIVRDKMDGQTAAGAVRLPVPVELAENPKTLGLSILADIKGIVIPDPLGISDHQRIKTYTSLFPELAELEDGLRLFDNARGEVYWLRGSILNLLKPIQKDKPGIVAHGEWKLFLKTMGIGRSTSENLRHVGCSFTRDEAREFGYSEMQAKLADRKKTLQHSPASETVPECAGAGNSDGGSETAAESTCQQAAADHAGPSEETVPTEGTSSSRVDGRAETEGLDPPDPPDPPYKQLRLKSVEGRFHRVVESLTFVAVRLAEAVDLYTNPDESRRLLDNVEGDIAAIRNRCDLILDSVNEACNLVDKFVRDGQFTEAKKRSAEKQATDSTEAESSIETTSDLAVGKEVA